MYEKFYGAKHPHPELLGTFVYGLPELNRARDQGGEVRRVAGLLRDHDRARAAAARARGHARRRGRARHRHHRLVGLGHRAAGRHAPPGPRRQPPDLQAARAPARARDRADARATPARKGVELRFVPVSAPLTRGIFATCFLELDAAVDERASSPRCSTRATRASRSCAGPKKRLPEVVAVAGSNYAEVGFAVGPVVERQAHRHLLLRDRQPDQGRRRPGDPEHEPRARLSTSARASRTSGTGRERRRSSSRSAARSSAPARRRVLAADLRALVDERRARRDRPRRRAAGDRAAEAARPRDQAGRRPARHRRRDARRHEDGRRRQAQRRPVRGARSPPARGRSACTARRRSSCARCAARRRSTRRRPRAGRLRASSATSSASTSSCSSRCGPPSYVPVIACLGADAEGGVYNINADIVGNQLAAALKRRAPVPGHVDARRAARRQRSVVAARRSSRAPRRAPRSPTASSPAA